MKPTQEKKNVHPLLSFAKKKGRVSIIEYTSKQKENSNALLRFLQMLDDGYVPNHLELECLYRIDCWHLAAADRLPESISELKNLEILHVSDTQISRLPESVCQLTKLEELDAGNTQISELPERICELVSLETLYVSDTQISKLPENIGLLKGLKVLDVSNTQISELPESICKLTDLECLDVSGTKIRELPEGICQLKSLIELNVSHTNMNKLPESIYELTALECLDVSNTQMSELPKRIEELTSLECLDVSNTQIKELSARLRELTYEEEPDESDMQKKREELKKLIEEHDSSIKDKELAQYVIWRLKQEDRSDLQNLAAEMQHAVNEETNPWGVFAAFLKSNFFTVVSALGSATLKIANADVLRGVSGHIMLGLKFFGKLYQLLGK